MSSINIERLRRRIPIPENRYLASQLVKSETSRYSFKVVNSLIETRFRDSPYIYEKRAGKVNWLKKLVDMKRRSLQLFVGICSAIAYDG